MKHNIRLDGLRGIAVLFVVVGHWLMLGQLKLANVGVQLFFVISGFLITFILINTREQIDAHRVSVSKGLKTFFIRRFLRIFPLYYSFLFLCYFFSYPDDSISNHFWYDIFYLNNFYQWFYSADLKHFTHLWSLSVEEWFYLIWPFLILLSDKKKTLIVILLSILSGLLFRAFYYSDCFGLFSRYPMGDVLLLASLDLFGYGALLAYLVTYSQESISEITSKKVVLLFAAGLSIYILCLLFGYKAPIIKLVSFKLGTGLMSIAAILYCLSDRMFVFDFIFKNKALVHIGKISYAVYLLHAVMPFKEMRMLYSSLFGGTMRFSLELVVVFIFLLFVCSLSWYLFELPINKLKDKFAPYSKG